MKYKELDFCCLDDGQNFNQRKLIGTTKPVLLASIANNNMFYWRRLEALTFGYLRLSACIGGKMQFIG